MITNMITDWNMISTTVKFGGLWIPSLLFADDVILLASSNSDLKLTLGLFAAERQAVGMTIGIWSHSSQLEKGELSSPGRGESHFL